MTQDSDAWSFYLAVADHLIANAPDHALVGLEVFASHIVRTIELTEERDKLRAELNSLKYIGQMLPSKERHTALWEAIEVAAQLFKSTEFGDAIFALTDAESSESKSTSAKAYKLLEANKIRLFWFHLGQRGPQNTPEAAGSVGDFTDMAANTGGIEVEVATSKVNWKAPLMSKDGQATEAGLQLMKQYNLLFNLYRIELGFPTPLNKGAKWQLKVKSPAGKRIELLYPPKLSDCGSQ